MTNFFFDFTFISPFLKTLVLVIVLFLFMHLTKKITKKYVNKNEIEPHRAKLVLNVFYLVYYLISFFLLFMILGLNLKEIGLMASSVLAVLGVGFFAQWSILSNMTASVILFFYHPIRIGDAIRIIDKEYEFVGVVKNITGFYILLHVEEGDRQITVPTTTILYKGIEIIKTKS